MDHVKDIEEISSPFKTLYGSKHLKFKKSLSPSPELESYTNELIYYILQNYVTLKEKTLQSKMSQLCKKYSIGKRPKYFILNYIIKQKIDNNDINEIEYNILNEYLISKKSRSLSGILEIAIMTSPGEFSCAYDCYYCPNQPGMPRSYVADGPSARRALTWAFDTVGQFHERASAYALNGHPVDKIEVIVLGGTWDSYDINYQREFITKVYFASNTFYNTETRDMLSMEEEILQNESAMCKIIGLTIETRPDQISEEQILRLLSYGVTRVQIGIQHTNNRILKGINRQCTIEQVYDAIYLLKEAGLKVQTHWMPNLPNSTPELDKRMFDELNYNPLLQSDDIKIYPTIVTQTSDRDSEEVYTVIEKWFNSGKYVPYSHEELVEVIIYGKENIRPWVRISRIFRDIPMGNILGGADVPNMREELAKKMVTRCRCIRCSEVKDRVVDPEDIKIVVDKYEASHSNEYFIGAESRDEKNNRILHGFVRLRIPHRQRNKWIKELDGCALIREVHVYGKLIPTFYRNKSNIKQQYNQHRGLGRIMIGRAEEIAMKAGFKHIAITSGVGARNYYSKIGYNMDGHYMVKALYNWCDIYIYMIYMIYLGLFILSRIPWIFYPYIINPISEIINTTII
jgi:ELP3 family radical SAM enzyme/protein acetyltransferase